MNFPILMPFMAREKRDWTPHIERAKAKYFEALKKPRKQKKRLKKEALYDYRFYKQMEEMDKLTFTF